MSRGRKRKMVVLSALVVAISISPAVGASAANPGSGSAVSPVERHEYKDGLTSKFAYYRENNLAHNVGHHNRHHGIRRHYVPV
ncbi:MAG: hypothetical protein OEM39_06715 [Acidimicrobiia bacterium]|nr:hypothetical protein [Acidimicrobiia bacterium]